MIEIEWPTQSDLSDSEVITFLLFLFLCHVSMKLNHKYSFKPYIKWLLFCRHLLQEPRGEPLPEDMWPSDDHEEQVGHRLKSVFLFIGHIQGKPFLIIGRVILLQIKQHRRTFCSSVWRVVSLLLCLSKEEKKLLIHNHVINDGQQRRKNLYTLTLNPHSHLLNEGFPLFVNAFFDLQSNFSVYVMRAV